MSIKIGIVGCGTIGRVHATAAQKSGVEIVGVSDLRKEAAAKLAGDFQIPFYTDNNDELMARPDVQAIFVCVPNVSHHPVTMAALKAGKDVFCEKPMALNAGQCAEMNKTAEKLKRILQVGFVYRYSTAAQMTKTLIADGRLGKLYHAKAAIYRRRGIPGLGGWFTTKSQSGGGPLIDIGVHILDLSMYLMNFPKVVRVSGKVYANFGKNMKKYLYEDMWAGPPNFKGVCDVEDAAVALIRLEGGMTLELNATWASNFPDGSVSDLMGFFGDKGGVSFKLGQPEVRLATEENGYNVDVIPKSKNYEPFVEQQLAFAAAVKKRSEPVAPGRHGQIIQSILDAIYESSEKDKEIEM